jgi:hypothetical protein
LQIQRDSLATLNAADVEEIVDNAAEILSSVVDFIEEVLLLAIVVIKLGCITFKPLTKAESEE